MIDTFTATTVQGEDFYVDWDGAEGNGFWFSSDEGNFSVSLGYEDSYRLYKYLWRYCDA